MSQLHRSLPVTIGLFSALALRGHRPGDSHERRYLAALSAADLGALSTQQLVDCIASVGLLARMRSRPLLALSLLSEARSRLSELSATQAVALRDALGRLRCATPSGAAIATGNVVQSIEPPLPARGAGSEDNGEAVSDVYASLAALQQQLLSEVQQMAAGAASLTASGSEAAALLYSTAKATLAAAVAAGPRGGLPSRAKRPPASPGGDSSTTRDAASAQQAASLMQRLRLVASGTSDELDAFQLALVLTALQAGADLQHSAAVPAPAALASPVASDVLPRLQRRLDAELAALNGAALVRLLGALDKVLALPLPLPSSVLPGSAAAASAGASAAAPAPDGASDAAPRMRLPLAVRKALLPHVARCAAELSINSASVVLLCLGRLRAPLAPPQLRSFWDACLAGRLAAGPSNAALLRILAGLAAGGTQPSPFQLTELLMALHKHSRMATYRPRELASIIASFAKLQLWPVLPDASSGASLLAALHGAAAGLSGAQAASTLVALASLDFGQGFEGSHLQAAPHAAYAALSAVPGCAAALAAQLRAACVGKATGSHQPVSEAAIMSTGASMAVQPSSSAAPERVADLCNGSWLAAAADAPEGAPMAALPPIPGRILLKERPAHPAAAIAGAQAAAGVPATDAQDAGSPMDAAQFHAVWAALKAVSALDAAAAAESGDAKAAAAAAAAQDDLAAALAPLLAGRRFWAAVQRRVARVSSHAVVGALLTLEPFNPPEDIAIEALVSGFAPCHVAVYAILSEWTHPS